MFQTKKNNIQRSSLQGQEYKLIQLKRALFTESVHNKRQNYFGNYEFKISFKLIFGKGRDIYNDKISSLG